MAVSRPRLEALAHPVRLRLLRTLARGPHTAGELADVRLRTLGTASSAGKLTPEPEPPWGQSAVR
ncbi:helix-turn-helix domain-containing protein [Streptomyces sp. NBC_00457]